MIGDRSGDERNKPAKEEKRGADGKSQERRQLEAKVFQRGMSAKKSAEVKGGMRKTGGAHRRRETVPQYR
jgi:hypothetical protein